MSLKAKTRAFLPRSLSLSAFGYPLLEPPVYFCRSNFSFLAEMTMKNPSKIKIPPNTVFCFRLLPFCRSFWQNRKQGFRTVRTVRTVDPKPLHKNSKIKIIENFHLPGINYLPKAEKTKSRKNLMELSWVLFTVRTVRDFLTINKPLQKSSYTLNISSVRELYEPYEL